MSYVFGQDSPEKPSPYPIYSTPPGLSTEKPTAAELSGATGSVPADMICSRHRVPGKFSTVSSGDRWAHSLLRDWLEPRGVGSFVSVVQSSVWLRRQGQNLAMMSNCKFKAILHITDQNRAACLTPESATRACFCYLHYPSHTCPTCHSDMMSQHIHKHSNN